MITDKDLKVMNQYLELANVAQIPLEVSLANGKFGSKLANFRWHTDHGVELTFANGKRFFWNPQQLRRITVTGNHLTFFGTDPRMNLSIYAKVE